MKSIRLKAPAKINIGLFVTRKRIDGYHDIETIFYPLNLYDELIISKSEVFNFTCNNPVLSEENDNLIVKTIKLLEKYSGRNLPVSIHLDKKIPIGAGMGGGSSDAAAMLLSINELFNLGYTTEILHHFALELGSDVPFFIKPLTSFAASRGENIVPINFQLKKPVLIINPHIHISTKWAYENIVPRKAVYDLRHLHNFNEDSFSSLKNNVINVFEEPVFLRHKEIKEIKDYCYQSGAEFSLMTGSGSTVFAIYNSPDEAKKSELFFKSKNYFTYINYED